MIKETTLCYTFDEDKVLLMYRDKKEIDYNKNKWIGIGGKLLDGETPEEGVRREFMEETGYELVEPRYCGKVDFRYIDKSYEEIMHVFTSHQHLGSLPECDEGTLALIPLNELKDEMFWEGDLVFMPLITTQTPFFHLVLVYDKNDHLVEHHFEKE
ncbi:MAG: NUDIX domain-containing protein [Erysipelotrichaceae bacterium]|nr:NUDIX domain-containing protein [Erysipelotrichaceae bacterium]